MSDPSDREVEVFNAALRLLPRQREAYLDEACQGDATLRRRLEILLQAFSQAGAFLEDPVLAGPDLVAARAAPDGPAVSASRTAIEQPGDRIGRYKLLQQIGEGGCGVVYMADQEEPVRRRVALKILKPGMDTRSVIARFEAERQALAMMEHPNIAQVLDAGATDAGRPYFVMELVRGVKITDYCDQHSLSTLERLDLLVLVCRAVQHAHQKGIIHRDLKPSNILITVNDGVPVPKVIDFGIAKATQGRLTDQTVFTAFEQFIGTPAYMSPEQASMTSLDVDTRSDIYSLGVLLYELLTGQTPFNQKELLSAGLDEMRRIIREQEPPRPSTRLSTLQADALTTVARNRQAEPPQLIHSLNGDLDWIVMRCLQKERGRRYETANGLAMDIARHLRNEPVLARPDSPAYRAAKFVRRHRAPVTFAGLILLALAGGLAGTLTQARRATRQAALAEVQRDFALRQLSRAEAINDLNVFLLSDAAPSGKRFTVGELLARAEQVIDRQAADSDENRVEMLVAIGRQYEARDEHEKARELLTKAYDLSRRLPEPAPRSNAACALAVAISLAGQFERAEALLQEALQELGDAPQFVFHRITCLLCGSRVAREGGNPEVGIERVQTAQRLLKGSRHGSALLGLTISMDLAESYRMAGRYQEADAAFQEASARLVALGRGDTEKAGTLLNNWGLTQYLLGKPREAERRFRRAIEISRADASDEGVSPMLLVNLARTLRELHRFEEARDYAERAYAKAKEAGDEIVVNQSLQVRANVYRQQKEVDRAAAMLAELEPRWKRMMPAGHIVFGIQALQYAQLSLAHGDAQTALAEANRAISLGQASPEDRRFLSSFLQVRAEVQRQLGHLTEAKTDATQAVAIDSEAAGPDTSSCWAGRSYLALGRVLAAQGNLGEARAAFGTAARHLQPTLGAEHPETQEAVRGLPPP